MCTLQYFCCFFFKQKTAYDVRISDWSSDVCSSDLFVLFDVLGRQMAIGPVIRFVGVVIAWRLDAPLVVFVIIWAVAAASEDLYLSWRGGREYHQRIGPPPDGELVGDSRFSEFSGLKSFLWVTYWQSNMDLVRKHLRSEEHTSEL